MSENYSTREGQAPDWMVHGLLRSASFAEQTPEKPMFNTGISMLELRTQIAGLLERCGVNLTAQEIVAGSRWLTQRTADALTDRDTQETLVKKMHHYVNGYVADKAKQRETGVSDRSPIHEPGWFDANFTPPSTDREAQRAADLAEHFRIGRKVTYEEGAALFEGLIATTERIASLDAAFNASDDDAKLVRARFENLALRFAAIVAGGNDIISSVKALELPRLCAEVVWMGEPSPRWLRRLEALSESLDEVVVASEAASTRTAYSPHNPHQFNVGERVHFDTDHPDYGRLVDDGVVLEVQGMKLLIQAEKTRAAVRVPEEDCSHHGPGTGPADVRDLKISMRTAAPADPVPNHFPGQTNLPGGSQQKSPYARHDWENQEEYNRHKVDVKKTDDQYVGGNVSSGTDEMSQRSVGGDTGNPIYVP